MGMNGLSEDPIPEGCYCYSKSVPCVYWERRPEPYTAHCKFLDKTDDVILWDHIKICGVKDDYKNCEPRYYSASETEGMEDYLYELQDHFPVPRRGHPFRS